MRFQKFVTLLAHAVDASDFASDLQATCKRLCDGADFWQVLMLFSMLARVERGWQRVLTGMCIHALTGL